MAGQKFHLKENNLTTMRTANPIAISRDKIHTGQMKSLPREEIVSGIV
jgi:hypothetical protein